MSKLKNELIRVHRSLCSAFVSEELFRRALGGGRADLGTIATYLRTPAHARPTLSVYFDRDYYLATNPQVQRDGDDPLLHFIECGMAERRSPHPLIDLQFIAAEDPDVLGAPPRVDALVEFLDYDLADPSPYFDIAEYRFQLGDHAPPHGLLRHFLTLGIATGRRPNAFLDPRWYGEQNTDVPNEDYGALRHFVILGDIEARAAGPLFDGRFYLARYPDVAEANQAPLRHYLRHGRHEGRQPATERVAATDAPATTIDATRPLPITADAVARHHSHIRARIEAVRQQDKDGVDVVPPALVKSRAPAKDIAKLKFAAVRSPVLSILIPVFNELDYTVECLLSLQRTKPKVAFEVVVADDCSTDPELSRLGKVAGLAYVRQPENRGFIGNCNAAFARCRGRYVLLLNNDTQLTPGAIDRMVAELDAHSDIAAVGPKIIYPNGRLQEAGCFILPNGEAGMVGLFRDPEEAGFCRDRDVAYCSGAALMVRREAVGGVLFDEAFRPAYCEDADLCLRLLAAGHRVRYVHDAVVVHHLSVSTNRLSATRRMRGVVRNQQLLQERWGDRLARMDAVRALAFYLPQFHPTPQNDFWWGPGFTEWTNVARARPSYVGHYQPHLPADLGYYDLRTRDTLDRQARLAARYGIAGFCVYYYNFGSHVMLSQPLEVVRASPEIAFNWCLCWANENWTKHWDGGNKEILLEQRYDTATLDSIIADAVAHAADPRYIRVRGRPLFLVYRPLSLPDPATFARSCRAAFERAGFAGVHLVYVESMEAVDRKLSPSALGFDACVEFPPHGRAVPAQNPAEIIKDGWTGYRYDYPETVLAFLRRESVPYPRYPAVFPSWDNTARQRLRGTSFDAASPEAFRVYVEEKIEEIRQLHMGDERLLFVNAWNEWAEGAHLEPDAGYGHRWLESLRDGLCAKRWT